MKILGLQLTIKQRLLCGFGFLIIIVALSTGTGWWAADNASDNVTVLFATDMPLLKGYNQALITFKKAEIEQKQFIHNKDLACYENAKKYITQTKISFQELFEYLPNEEKRSKIKTDLFLLENYSSNLEKVLELLTQKGLTHNEGLEGRLRKAVHKVEKVVTDQGLAELTVLMLMCRRHEKDYLLRGDEKYLGKIAQRIKEFKEQMELFGMSEDNSRILGQLLQDYFSGMQAIVAIDKQIKSASATMNQDTNKLENSIEEFAETVRNSIDQKGHVVIDGLSNSRTLLSVILVIAVVISIMLGIFITLSITKPIKQVVDNLKDIAEGNGDLTIKMPDDSRDELGELCSAFNTFVEKLHRIIRDVAGSVETLSISSQDLSTLSERMSLSAEDSSEKSQSVATASEEMNANMNSLSSGSEQASGNISTVAASAEEMSSTINEIASNSSKAGTITSNAVTQAKSASRKVEKLGMAAKKISNVTEVITEIAEQTNLLALNATIEAARAGEAGKGFAVVATEIKELAKQTAQATQDIKQQIDDIQSSTEDTVDHIKEISEIIVEINTIVLTITSAVEEQSSATQEIAGNVSMVSQVIQEVNANVAESSTVSGEISRNISDVNISTIEIAGNSSQVNVSAKDLNNLSDRLKQIVTLFKIKKPEFEIGLVKNTHLQWRSKLEGLLHGHHDLNPEEVTSHHECSFGKWYEGPDAQKLKKSNAFEVVGKHHKNVHDYARKIVEFHHNGEEQKAKDLMKEFESERKKLFEALDELYLA